MPPRKKSALKEGEHHLRLFVNGAGIEIISPIERDKFLEEMVNDINHNGAKVAWSGWFSLRSAHGGVVSIRIRAVDAIEEVK
tara:strand:+ start:2007 stop:2252 length:246 start_codon:yes stop_codon:yes gene_type:complete